MENNTKIIELERKIEELTRRLDLFNSNTTIPYDVGEAFKNRLAVVGGDSNAKTGASETVTFTEGTAANPMDGFITIIINGNSRNIPYYN